MTVARRIPWIAYIGISALLGMVGQAGAASYQYDSLYRLTQVQREDGTVIKYEYDELGNRTRKLVVPPADVPTWTPTLTATPTPTSATATPTVTPTRTPTSTTPQPTNTATGTWGASPTPAGPSPTPPVTLTPTPTVLACVVGTGTGASCTESALDACLPGGGSFDGTVTFNCGGVATITVTSTKTISADTTIDGGSLITISGGHSVGVFSVNLGVKFTVQNLTIANGSSAGGGGIVNAPNGLLTVANCTFSGNSAYSYGGGIYSDSPLTVTNSTFSGNSLSYYYSIGGGIYCGGPLTVTNSTFSGNSAGYSGGGIYSPGTLTVSNSTFSGNTAGYTGGGINSRYDTLTVTNSTFSGNSAGSSGGGIYSDWGTVTNTIVANSTSGGNCGGAAVTDGGHNIDDGTTCGFRGTGCSATGGTSFCNTIPVLDPAGLQNNGGPTQTVALCTGAGAPSAGCTGASPGINAGDESVCSTTTGAAPVNNLDQRGYVRPGTGATKCSIGAFEANSVAPTATPTSTPTRTPMIPPATPVCVLDVDGSGRPAQVATDVVYIARRLLGFAPVPPGFRAADPSIPSDATIAANIDAAKPSFDVDQRGGTQVATDIVYIARRLLGFAPVPPNFRTADPTIPSDAEIAARIDALCP